jgi:cytochrome c oxidase cbb3-type subunit III
MLHRLMPSNGIFEDTSGDRSQILEQLEVAESAVDLYTAVGAASGPASRSKSPALVSASMKNGHTVRATCVAGARPTKFTRKAEGRFFLCAAVLLSIAGQVSMAAAGQQAQASQQEGVQQQSYQNMTPAQRAAATRSFLGLGAEPDKAAAERGAPLFASNCAFCHGSTARGATGPSLITSDLVLADDHGERLVPFLKAGNTAKGMPAFATVPDDALKDIVEFLHLQVEAVANRGTYKVLNIVVGNAEKGKEYVEGHCRSCHTAESFAHIASKFRSPDQLQRHWVWPTRDGSVTAEVKTQTDTISGRVTQISDFRITLVDASGRTHMIERGPQVEVNLRDSLEPHAKLVMTLTNDDLHNVTAFLETQR